MRLTLAASVDENNLDLIDYEVDCVEQNDFHMKCVNDKIGKQKPHHTLS